MKENTNMNGKITFQSAESLAAFLKSFVGETPLFEVEEEGGQFILTFEGGY